MDTHAPEPWFRELARWVQLHGAALAGARGTPVKALRIDLHHLYYLLLRCEGLGLPVGPLDEEIGPHRAKLSHIVPAEPSLPRSTTLDDVRSLFSFQSTASFWGAAPEDPDAPFRQLFRALMRVRALELRAPATSRIAGCEDMPGDNATPLHAFRALAHLDTVAVDPAAILGWDRLCIQLQALSCRYMQLEDITDLFIGLVRRDWAGSGTGGERELPSAAWHALRYVCLANNELTFVPDTALSPLHALTHLDLSSNLLNAVPPALAELPSLRVLSVADNMIDSVLGIYALIPHVRRLSLRGNRLESICGLERLGALEQVDLRHNYIADPGEIGRLAQIRTIASVWVTPNPLSEDMRARAACLAYFAPDHPDLALDGRKASWIERRRMPQAVAPVATEAHVASTVRRVTHSDAAPRRQPLQSTAQRLPRSTTHSAEQLKARMERLRGTQGDEWLKRYARDTMRPPSYDVHAPNEGRSLVVAMFANPIGAAVLSAAALIGGYSLWWRFFRRIPNTAYITPAVLRHRRTLVGRVTSVGDADGFRLYHTPGIPFLRDWLHKPPTKASELRNQTISVRLAGADAPESAHFGREAQPFSKEARDELQRLVSGKTVWLDVAHLDQYQRLVATVHVFAPPYIFGRTNVGLQLVEKGLATVYRSAGAAYGHAPWLTRWLRHEESDHAALERAEAKARAARRGMWGLGRRLVTPREFKARARHS